MVEYAVLSAVMVLFKAVFAGEDLDRKVGADVISTMFNGLLRTTSPTDPVLLKVYEIVKNLDSSAYQQAMESGHRYLAESQLGADVRVERLKLARERLVDAASAAKRMQVPMLVANAELAIAKCDALLAAPEHAAMALDRAAATLEQAIEDLDAHGAGRRWRSSVDYKSTQNDSVSEWLTRAANRELIRQRDIDALAKAADDVQVELNNLTALYSEVQTAILASAGHEQPVLWAQAEGESVRTGLNAKAVTTVTGRAAVRGFGLTVQVEQHLVTRDSGGALVVQLLLNVTAHEDRYLYSRTWASPGAQPPSVRASVRGLAALFGPLNPGGSRDIVVPKGSYQGVLTVPVSGSAVEMVKITISRPASGGRWPETGGCIFVPIS